MLTESSRRFPVRKGRASKPIRVILREQLLSTVLNDGSGSKVAVEGVFKAVIDRFKAQMAAL